MNYLELIGLVTLTLISLLLIVLTYDKIASFLEDVEWYSKAKKLEKDGKCIRYTCGHCLETTLQYTEDRND